MSAAYYDGKLKNYYVKRFNIETNTMNKKFLFISQEKGSKLKYASFRSGETMSFKYFSNKKLQPTEINLDQFIDVKGWKSIGNKINFHPSALRHRPFHDTMYMGKQLCNIRVYLNDLAGGKVVDN